MYIQDFCVENCHKEEPEEYSAASIFRKLQNFFISKLNRAWNNGIKVIWEFNLNQKILQSQEKNLVE